MTLSTTLRAGIASFMLAGLFIAPANAQSSSGSVINLAYVLPSNQPSSAASTVAPAPHSSLSQSAKLTYDAALFGTGALIASDDRGLYRTIQGPHGASSGLMNTANDITHLGDLGYVAPLVGLVYLSGGHTNKDLAWKAGVAVLKAGAIGLVLKDAVGRKRPGSYNPGSGGEFKPFNPGSDYDSFPSGHSIVAFSVATVWADEKPKEKYLAYGLATLVGASRIIKTAHWPSDVFFGAAIGVWQGSKAANGDTDLFNLKF